MPGEAVEIKGVWTSVEDPQYPVTYSWTGLPEGAATLPTGASYYAGDAVTVDTTFVANSTVKVGHDTYAFSGWDKADFTMPGEAVVIYGTWEITDSDPTYRVTYEYTGSVPSNAPAVPVDTNAYYAGEDVTVAGAPYLSGYIFSGWDKEDFTMPAENVVIYGSWTRVGGYNPPVEEEEIPEENPPLSDVPEEEIPEEDPPLAGTPGEEEEILEEDVPLADVPATGDMTAIWAAASVVSAAGLLFVGKKREDEE